MPVEKLDVICVDSSQVTRFIRKLFDDKPSNHYILIWTLEGRRSKFFKNLTSAEKYIISINEPEPKDIYIGCCTSPIAYKYHERCLAKDVIGINAFWLDIDIAGDGHKSNKVYPQDTEAAINFISKLPLKPSMIVNSGNGLHAWWVFDEFKSFDSDQERTFYAESANNWQTYCKIIAKENGYDIDSVHDLARVMRIAGSVNCKGNKNKPTSIIEDNNLNYNINDFKEYFTEEIVNQTKQLFDIKQSNKSEDLGIVIDISAGVPPDKWSLACGNFPSLQGLFDHEKSAIKHLSDQSNSSIDLSLASKMYNLGWGNQLICNLLVAHRLKHDPNDTNVRTGRLKYFEDTIKRAHIQLKKEDAQERINSSADFEEIPIEPEKLQDYRDKTIKDISERFGINIFDIVELRTEPPRYRIYFDKTKYVHFEKIDDLCSPTKFRNAIAQGMHKVINIPKGKDWQNILQQILNACRIQDVGFEATELGAVTIWLKQYLESTQISDKEDATDSAKRQHPFYKEYKGKKYIALFGSKFKKFLWVSNGESITRDRIGIMLGKALGGLYKTVRQGESTYSVWLIDESFMNGDDENV